MKTHCHLLLPALLFSPVAVGLTSTLHAQVIEFKNVKQLGLRLCVYNEADRVILIALQCWHLEPGDGVKWNRGKDNSKFHVQLYYAPPDPFPTIHLCQHYDFPADVGRVEVGYTVAGKKCQFNYGNEPSPVPTPAPAPAPTLESVLNVCNQSIGEKVNFAIAYIVDVTEGVGATHVVAEGWWEVGKGECKAIPLSDRLKKWRTPGQPAGLKINPHFYIYGETEGFFGGAIRRVMEGDESDPNDISVCISGGKNFEYRQQPTNSPRFGMAAEKKCADKRIRMADVTRHSEDLSEFHWTF